MHRKRRHRGSDLPPFVDPMFAKGLAPHRSNRETPDNRENRRSGRKPDHKTHQLCRQMQGIWFDVPL